MLLYVDSPDQLVPAQRRRTGPSRVRAARGADRDRCGRGRDSGRREVQTIFDDIVDDAARLDIAHRSRASL